MRSQRFRSRVAVALVALSVPLSASADDRDEVRRSGTCTGLSETRLRLRGDDGRIRVELEIEHVRRGSRWSVILLHERRIAFRGTLRARSDSLELERAVPDWFGSDTVAARATGPRGAMCRVSATL